MFDAERHRIERLEFRKMEIRDWFVKFSSAVLLPWLHRIAKDYKERNGVYLNGVTLLPHYYKEVRDKEIAALASLFITEKRMMEQVKIMREILTPSPWNWFVSRGFVELGTGKVMGMRISGWNYGAKNIEISEFFDKLQDKYLQTGSFPSGEDIKRLLPPLPQMPNNLRWLRIVLEDDVYGGGLSHDRRLCPITKDVTELLKVCFPNYRAYGTVDDAISLFAFDDDSDFFYAALAFKELSKSNPKGCRKMRDVIPRWYSKGEYVCPVFWKRRFPWMFD